MLIFKQIFNRFNRWNWNPPIKIYSEAGVSFNLESPQLGEVLLTDENTLRRAKTKTGQYSTNEETLSALAFKYPIAATLLDYRELTKLRSTYVDALPQLINPAPTHPYHLPTNGGSYRAFKFTIS